MNDEDSLVESPVVEPSTRPVFLDVEDLKTEVVLSRILTETVDNKRFSFLVKRGQAVPLLGRLRVKLSRVRIQMQERQVKMQHFRLRSEHFRYDNEHTIVTVWRFKSTTNEMLELYQDMIREGKVKHG